MKPPGNNGELTIDSNGRTATCRWFALRLKLSCVFRDSIIFDPTIDDDDNDDDDDDDEDPAPDFFDIRLPEERKLNGIGNATHLTSSDAATTTTQSSHRGGGGEDVCGRIGSTAPTVIVLLYSCSDPNNQHDATAEEHRIEEKKKQKNQNEMPSIRSFVSMVVCCLRRVPGPWIVTTTSPTREAITEG